MKRIQSFATIVALLLLSVVVQAENARQLVVQASDGTKVSYLLRNQPQLSFNESGLVVTSEAVSYVYSLPETAKLFYETIFIDENEGLHDLQTDEVIYRFDGDALIFPALKSDSRISVYGVNGSLLFDRAHISEGEYIFSLDNLQTGVYVFHVNDITCKIIKQ